MEIVIPARRNFFLWGFLTVWLLMWGVGETVVAGELFSGRQGPPDLFIGAFLIAWTLGGGLAIYIWLWTLAGREVIGLRSTVLAVKREILGVGRTREYDLNYVRNMRVSPEPYSPWDWTGAMRFWGILGGPVAFDYGARTYRFGGGVDEAEAREIAETMMSAHKFRE